MKDLCLQDKEIFELIHYENDCQIFKWGIQDRGPFEWLSIIAEEFGELAKAINEEVYRGGTREGVIKEAIQTATLCLKIAEMYKNDELPK